METNKRCSLLNWDLVTVEEYSALTVMFKNKTKQPFTLPYITLLEAVIRSYQDSLEQATFLQTSVI